MKRCQAQSYQAVPAWRRSRCFNRDKSGTGRTLPNRDSLCEFFFVLGQGERGFAAAGTLAVSSMPKAGVHYRQSRLKGGVAVFTEREVMAMTVEAPKNPALELIFLSFAGILVSSRCDVLPVPINLKGFSHHQDKKGAASAAPFSIQLSLLGSSRKAPVFVDGQAVTCTGEADLVGGAGLQCSRWNQVSFILTQVNALSRCQDGGSERLTIGLTDIEASNVQLVRVHRLNTNRPTLDRH